MYTALPASDSSDGSLPPSPDGSCVHRPPRLPKSTLPVMCMDTSVASLVLDGRLLSGDE